MAASKSKEQEYIDLMKSVMQYAEEHGTLPGTSDSRYRDICNLRRGIKTGRIAPDRPSVKWINENCPDLIGNWTGYRKMLESKEYHNGKINKKQFSSKEFLAIMNEIFPDEVYLGVNDIKECLYALRDRWSTTYKRRVVIDENIFSVLSKYIRRGGSLKISYADYILASVILYGDAKDSEYMGREETVGYSTPVMNNTNKYIDLFFKAAYSGEFDILLDKFLDDTVYIDEYASGENNGYYSKNYMRNIVSLYDYYSGETLEEVGKKYNLTRERVRQIVTKVSRRCIKKYRSRLNEIMIGRNYGQLVCRTYER